MTKVVITGLGVITPYGIGKTALWSGLVEQRNMVRQVTGFETSHLHCSAGGQLTTFTPDAYLNTRLVRKIDRFSMFGLITAQQALTDAGLTEQDLSFPVSPHAPEVVGHAEGRDRVGMTVGNNLGGWEFAERELYNLWQKGPRDVSPYMATAWFPAAVQGNISIQFGIKGIGRTFLADRVGGAYALIHAARCLQRGQADLMFAGGTEAPFSPYAALCYQTSGLMSKRAGEMPTTSNCPFDEHHDGLVPGEGAAFLIMEREENALARGASIYAELAGWGITNDGYHPVSPAPDGRLFAQAMRMAMQQASIVPEQIDAVFAAGASVPEEDSVEALAIRAALGEAADRVPVTAPKAAFGNLFGAATPVDVAIALLALQEEALPVTLNLEHPIAQGLLNYVTPHQPLPRQSLRIVAVNAHGIGGSNACLILKKWTNEADAQTVAKKKEN